MKHKARILSLGFLSVLALGLVALAQKSDEPGANIDAPASVTEGQYTDGTLGTVEQPQPATSAPDAVYGVTGAWPTYTPALAPGKGRDVVTANCSICHSTAYITMSPPVSADAWHDTVYKMLNTYGASEYISEETADKVVAYLGAHYTPETISASSSAATQQASQQPTQTGSAATPGSGNTQSGNAAVEAAQADSAGAQVYSQNCVSCHQTNGQGVPGAFPPLAGHIPSLYKADGGRTYLAHVLLYGLQGQINVKGASYNGQMPAWGGSLSDQQIAEVLNYSLTAWDNNTALSADFKPYAAADIKTARAKSLSAQQVYEERQKLDLP